MVYPFESAGNICICTTLYTSGTLRLFGSITILLKATGFGDRMILESAELMQDHRAVGLQLSSARKPTFRLITSYLAVKWLAPVVSKFDLCDVGFFCYLNWYVYVCMLSLFAPMKMCYSTIESLNI